MDTVRKHLPTAARLFLGLVFTVFGLNFFLHFLPTPPPPPRAATFAGALFGSGYFFPLLKTTEVVAGLLLLAGRFVTLALAVLAPIVINIVGFHLFLAPAGMPQPCEAMPGKRPFGPLGTMEKFDVAVTLLPGFPQRYFFATSSKLLPRNLFPSTAIIRSPAPSPAC